MLPVLGGQLDILCGHRPFYADLRVVPNDCSFRLGMIEFIALVLEHSFFGQDDKTMGESLGDEELSVVLFSQLATDVLSVSPGTFADIHGHIQHTTPNTTHKFALRVGRILEMQAAKHTIVAFGLVVLHKIHFHSRLGSELLRIERLEEISTGISEHLGLNYQNPVYRCLYYLHLTQKERLRLCLSHRQAR